MSDGQLSELPPPRGPRLISPVSAASRPQEAAALLNYLEDGCQAAWQAQHEARFNHEGQARFATAAELDAIRVDAWWATVENGMRHPGEPLDDFTERANRQPGPDAERETGC